MNIRRLLGSLLIGSLVLLPGATISNTLEQQRLDFLLAEKFAEQGDEAAFLDMSARLVGYPLYPYLQYRWLKNNLSRTDQVLAFLSDYKDSRPAGLLRSKWLDHLAGHERWAEFIQYYQAGDSAALECQFYWAHYKTGNQQRALGEAKRLWSLGDTQPRECDPLLSALTLSPALTPDLIWQRFELALKKGNRALASQIRQLLDTPGQAVADAWLRVDKNPALILDNPLLGGNEQQGRIFAHGVEKMLKSDLDLAVTLWDGKKPGLAADSRTVGQLERKLALALAHARDARAYERLNRLLDVDAETREWKVRSALLEQNWPHVAAALSGLTPAEQQEPQWQYWRARSLAATGNALEGQAVYERLSADRSFYGFMAADAVNKPYAFADKPVFLADNALETLARQTDFKTVQELAILNRDMEAKRQWWFTVNKLPREQRMVAAKLAQQWQWDQIAIITLVKADYWDDLALRFPLAYLSQVQDNASSRALDPAVIFGVMRQESMLDKNARSAVGARGLMQLMPATGRQIARSLNEPWGLESRLFDPDINIKYGAFYYKQLLDRFGGQLALATAAYNAGPGRVTQWLPNDRPMPADVWIETIPFRETRKYVTSVLSYSLIYQQRLQGNALKMTKLLFDVHPR